MKHRLNGLFGYMLSIGLAVIFALFLSGRVGWFLVLAFVLAPVLSVIMTWCVSRKLRIMAEPDGNRISKGEAFRLCIELENRCFLPSPLIVLTIRDCVSLKTTDKTYLVSVMGFSREEFNVEYQARICGSAWIGIENVVVQDYFGIFSFKVKTASEPLQWSVGIIPEVAEISERDERVSKIISSSVQVDNSEDTVESVVTSLMGFPGCENREYMPGDPLKRINWKLSAKREQLLVRMDEETPGLSVNVVLDSVFADSQLRQEMLPSEFAVLEQEEQLPMVAQAAMEDSLGIAAALMKCNYTVVYYVHGKQHWEEYRLRHEQDLSELRKVLAYYGFVKEEAFPNALVKERMPYESVMTEKETRTLLCTPCADIGLEQEIKAKTGARSTEIMIYPITG